MAKKAKKPEKVEAVQEPAAKETKRAVIFCAFCAGSARAITEDGRELSRQSADNEDEAKRALGYESDNLHPIYNETFGANNWRLVWVADPGNDAPFMEACKLMEAAKEKIKQDSELPAKPLASEKPSEPAAEAAAETPAPAESATAGTGEGPEYIYRDLEVEVSTSEQKLRGLIADLEEAARLLDSETESWKMRKKDLEKSVNTAQQNLFNATSGRARTTIRCLVEKDFENDVKRIVRTDTMEVVETLPLRIEEKQTKLPLAETKPAEAATETPADETKPAEGETAAPANETPAPESEEKILEISAVGVDGDIRTVDALDDQGQWIGVPFEDLAEGATIRLFEADGTEVKDAAGNTVFVTQGEAYEGDDCDWMIKAVAKVEPETEGPSEEEMAGAEDVKPEAEAVESAQGAVEVTR